MPDEDVTKLQAEIAALRKDQEVTNMFVVRVSAHVTMLLSDFLAAMTSQDPAAIGAVIEEAETLKEGLKRLYAKTYNQAATSGDHEES